MGNMTALNDNMKDRPNVLWIMTDQFNAGCLGTGNRGVRTPNLDKLSADGVRFDRAYCNNPICSPSRISFITGQYPHNHKVLGNSNFELEDFNDNTLSSVFRRAGFQTALIGKAHMIKNWDQEGFEHIRYCDLCDADPDDPFSVAYFKYLYENGLADEYDLGAHPETHRGFDRTAFISNIPKRHCVETWTGDEGLRFLKERDTDRPFFMQLSFERPHEPHTVPYDSGLLYDPEEIVLPENAADLFENGFKGHHKAMQEYVNEVHGCPYRPLDKKELKRQLAFYYSLITYIDEQFGRVVEYLKKTGQYDNTIIIFTADHGEFAGDHGLVLKNIGIFDSVHRIPFIIKYPGSPAGKVVDEMIESVDLYPTLCELTRVPAPERLDGKSLKGIIEDGERGKDYTVCEWSFVEHYDGMVYAIVNKEYRLVYFNETREGELYDINNDPGEMNNLYYDPAYAQVKEQMMQTLMPYMGFDAFKTTLKTDQAIYERNRGKASCMIHTGCKKWSHVETLKRVKQKISAAGSLLKKDSIKPAERLPAGR